MIEKAKKEGDMSPDDTVHTSDGHIGIVIGLGIPGKASILWSNSKVTIVDIKDLFASEPYSDIKDISFRAICQQ